MFKKEIFVYILFGTLLMLLIGVVYSYSMFRLEIETTLNVNKFASGIPYMIALFFFSFFMAIGGFMYSKMNSTFIALLGVVFVGLGFILSSFAHTITLITITYGVIVGTGVGLLYGLPLRIIPQLGYQKVGFLTGIVLLGFGMSPLIFAPVINKLLTLYGLSSTFLYIGILFLITLLPFALILSKRDLLPKRTNKLDYSIIKNRKFLSLYFLFFTGTFIGYFSPNLCFNIARFTLLKQPFDINIILRQISPQSTISKHSFQLKCSDCFLFDTFVP